jgi:toxin ParE1/3/4
VSKILETARNVRDFPLIERIVPEIEDEGIRERFIYSYRLVYRIEEKRILVVAVIHGKRLFDNIAERFKDGT